MEVYDPKAPVRAKNLEIAEWKSVAARKDKRIKDLEAEVERLRKALEEIADIHSFEGPPELAAYANENRLKSVTIAARDALSKERLRYASDV